MYELSDFEYDLPQKLIAQKPLVQRDSSKLLVLDRSSGSKKIKKFSDISDYISPEDVIVINETKVIPARLFGKKGDKTIELFLLRELEENVWEIMVRPGKKAKKGDVIYLDEDGSCKIQDIMPDGNRIAFFDCSDDFYDYIENFGKMPLPPYIKRESDTSDRERYQTVFASVPGAVAAPTAGLHFTEELLDKIKQKGTKTAGVTLHVGAGTFRPIKTESIHEHKMHSERYFLSRQTADIINGTRSSGGKIFAVGTTTVRTLETLSDENGNVHPGSGETDIFIYPGYKFKAVDHMVTNFHLPRSSLMLMVSAFSSIEQIKNAYHYAVDKEMRFYSYGDAMLIL